MPYESMEKYIGMYLDNRYELLEIIGSGGMAVVFKARCHRLNRLVAIKIMRPEFVGDERFAKRFQIESQAIALLSHPNIVGVYDVSHSDSIEYIVMELLEGDTLKQRMQKAGGLLPVREALNYTTQITKALVHAHSKGVVHRDIKPQNILVVDNSTIKVADFGIAALETEMKSESGEAVGSVHYISPEQAKGQVADGRSDIYSLGIVLYEMLTGKLPFDGEDDRTIALKHLTATAEPAAKLNPKVSPEIEKIIAKSMNANPDDRFQTAQEMLDALEKVNRAVSAPFEDIEGNVVPIGTTGEMSREGYDIRRRRSSRVSTFSGIFGVLAFILFLGIFLWNYWLHDIFVVNSRIDIPNFVGSNYETIINSKNFNHDFNFNLTYEINPEVEKGIIIRQEPEAGKSYMLTEDGINVNLIVSTGVMLTDIPDVTGYNYRDATAVLEKAGFVVEKQYANSPEVPADGVISINPPTGEKLPAGATVYLTVSLGPEELTTIMPFLVGQPIDTARAMIMDHNLQLVTVSEVHSDVFPEGQVVSQNVEAGTEIAVNSKIYLQVSIGPEETPTPEPTAEPTPEAIPAGGPEA